MDDIIDGAVAVVRSDVQPLQPAQLLAIAAQRGATLDELDRFIGLQERFDANEARKAFNAAFAAFKAAAIKIVRDRKITDGPLKGKSHATLAGIINVVTPELSRHDLSLSWKTTKDDKDWIEVTCHLKHKAGHVESVSMGGPPDAGGAKNAIQARASTTSYLQRYTAKSILGLAEQDDDDDGNGNGQPVVDLAGAINGLADLTDDAAVQAYWKAHREPLKAHRASYDAFAKAVAARRRELVAAKEAA
jgi:hypothetical protein